MLRFFLKEASLLVAFVVLGGLLLLCLWITNHLNQSILKEFKDTQISVILKPDAEEDFKAWVEKAPGVIRFRMFSALDNKDRLGAVYPELKSLVLPLDQKFFPSSVIVTVSNAAAFTKALSVQSGVVESQVLHQPPVQLRRFLNILTFVFSGLWLLTLTLVLYFNLERLTVVEDQKWSLMKLLGARTFPVFLPLWYGQTLRVTIASVFAILLAVLSIRQIQSFFVWDWISLPALVWIAFFFVSVGLTSAISFSLFYYRYRQVPLG